MNHRGTETQRLHRGRHSCPPASSLCGLCASVTLWFICLPLILVAAAGCEKQLPLGEVTGTVTLGGEPLAGVLVVFNPDPAQQPEAPRSTGGTDEQGRYRLQCDDGRPGAVPGAHTVTILDLALDAPVVIKGSDDENLPQARPRSKIAAVYQSPSTSPLHKDVSLGEQTIDLQLDAR